MRELQIRIETYYDPEYGAIAIAYNAVTGQVIGTGYDPPMSGDNQ